MRWRTRLLAASSLLAVAALACGTLLTTDNDEPTPETQPDAAAATADGASDALLVPIEPNDLDPDPGGPPPVLVDAGCEDAAFSESFDQASFTLWSTSLGDAGGSIGLDTKIGSAPPSLRAQVYSPPVGTNAYASRSVCPASKGVVTCSFALRVDTTTSDGDIGILDLRGGGGMVARVKGREIMFLSNNPDGGSQIVARAPINLTTFALGTFHKFILEVTPTEYRLTVDDKLVATLSVPLPIPTQLSIHEVRAGITYMTGKRDPGWDIHVDELHCSFQ